MSNLTLSHIEPPFRGLDTVSSPDYVAKGSAPVMENFLPGRSGKAILRGRVHRTAFNQMSSSTTATPLEGYWVNDSGHVLAHYGNDTDYKPLDPVGDAPLAAIAVDPTAHNILPSYATIEGGTYGLVQNDHVYVWTPATFPAAGAMTARNDSPLGGSFACSHLNRLFILGGSKPGTSSPLKSSSLFWSIDGGPTGNAPADWQDEVSGLVNEIIVPAGADFGMSMISLNGVLVIFMRHSTYVMYGSSPANFTLKKVLDIGATSRGGMVADAHGVYFMSDAGYMYFDGVQVRNVSDPVRTELLTAQFSNGTPYTYYYWNNIPFTSAAKLADNHILLIITDIFGNVLFSKALHTPSGSWWTFSSPIMEPSGITNLHTPGPGTLVNVLGQAWAYDQRRWWRVDTVALPEVVMSDIITTPGIGADVGINVDGDIAVPAVAYPAQIDTRVQDLSSPASMSRLSRIMVDYSIERLSFLPAADSHIDMSLYAGDGTQLVAPTQLTPGTGRKRSVTRDYSEVEEAFIRFTYVNSDNAAIAKAEVYDSTLEWRAGRPRFA